MGQVRNPRIGRARQVPGGPAVLKGDGQLRKMRCMKCKEMMFQTRKPDGKMIYRCSCGAEMACTVM